MKIKLTKSAIDKLEPGSYMVTFAGYPGLSLRVRPNGRKVFTLDYSVPGHARRRLTIGPWGPVTLEGETSVLKRYGEAVAMAAMGKDPMAPRETAKGMPTFRELAAEYGEHIKLHRKSPKMDIYYLELASKEWGHLKLDQITRRMVIGFRNKLSENGQHNQNANKARVAVCTCFNWAIEMEYVTVNPASKIKDLPVAEPRTRTLTEEEMDSLLTALNQEDPFTRAAYILMIETGCRQGETITASWGDFDLEKGLWTIPAYKSKSGRTDTIPISETVISTLRDLGPRSAEDPVIPALRRRPNGSKHRGQLHATWDRIKRNAGLPDDLNMHDIRRTFGLRVCLQSGLHVASRLLRHSSIKVTEQVYAPLGVDVRGVNALRQAVNGVSLSGPA